MQLSRAGQTVDWREALRREQRMRTAERTQARTREEWEAMQVQAATAVHDALAGAQEVRASRDADGQWRSVSIRLQRALRYLEDITPPEDDR